MLASREGAALRTQVRQNAELFRTFLAQAGFTLAGQGHPIIPVMLGQAQLAQDMAAQLLQEGVYVTGFSFPVVPKGKARIRTQMSAAHTPEQIEQAAEAFTKVGRALGAIGEE